MHIIRLEYVCYICEYFFCIVKTCTLQTNIFWGNFSKNMMKTSIVFWEAMWSTLEVCTCILHKQHVVLAVERVYTKSYNSLWRLGYVIYVVGFVDQSVYILSCPMFMHKHGIAENIVTKVLLSFIVHCSATCFLIQTIFHTLLRSNVLNKS